MLLLIFAFIVYNHHHFLINYVVFYHGFCMILNHLLIEKSTHLSIEIITCKSLYYIIQFKINYSHKLYTV